MLLDHKTIGTDFDAMKTLIYHREGVEIKLIIKKL